MPRWLRFILTVICFGTFFGGSILLGSVFFPLLLPLALFDLGRLRNIATAFVSRGYGAFLFFMKFCRLIDYEMPTLPEELRGQSYLVVANHPSLIDVLFLLHSFRGLTSLVKGSWYRSFIMGAVLRFTHYLPNDTDGDPENLVVRMENQLRSGHPLVVFPEGTRSSATALRRFKRGAFEAAIRAGVPILPVFIQISHKRFLMKGQPLLSLPDARVMISFEVLDVVPTRDENGEAVCGRELRNRMQADFRERWARWVEIRDRGDQDAKSSVPREHSASAL